MQVCLSKTLNQQINFLFNSQIRILRILALLGANQQSVSDDIGPIVFDCMIHASSTGENVCKAFRYLILVYYSGLRASYCVVFECVRTLASIWPNKSLLIAAAKCASQSFLSSANGDIRFAGLRALSFIATARSTLVSGKSDVELLDFSRFFSRTSRRNLQMFV